MATAQKPQDPRTLAFTACATAALVLIGTFNNSWATAGRGVGIGPTGIEVCLGPVCRGVPWRGVSGDIQLFATLSLILGIAAAIALAAYGGGYLAGKHAKLPAVKVASRVLGLAAFAMTFFLIRTLFEGHGMSFSWGSLPAIGGVIGGGVALKRLAPYLVATAPAAAALPPTVPSGVHATPQSCPRCGTLLSYVASEQRWFCSREQQYL